MRKNSIKKFAIKSKSLKEIKKINLQKLGLNKVNDTNIYVYHSNVFRILSYKIKSDLNFLIFFDKNKICIELINIKGIPELVKRIIKINIKVDIYQEENICTAQRFISLDLKNDKTLLNFFSDKITEKLLSNALEKISERFDRKFLNKVIN